MDNISSNEPTLQKLIVQQNSKDQLMQTVQDFKSEPLDAATKYVAAPFIIGTAIATGSHIIKYMTDQVIGLFSWAKNSIIRYDYTPEQAAPELLAIETAHKEGLTEVVEVATTKHFINTLNSISGHKRLAAGDPHIEQHAKILAPYTPEYVKFLLCINRYHKYADLISSVPEDKELHPDFGACKPPYEIEKYLINHPEKTRLAEFIKRLTTQKNTNEQQERLIPADSQS
jgi:hypothetical protein